MNLWLASGALMAILAAFGLFQRGQAISARADAAALRLELASAEAARAQAEEASRIHRAHIQRLEQAEERWTDIENELRTMEGRDAPLSPLLRATADRLWK
jgi:hypothetical protein